MPIVDEVVFGKFAMALGLVSSEQMDECMEVQEQDDSTRAIAEILQERGYLSEGQYQRVFHMHREALMESPVALEQRLEDIVFGKLVVRNRFVTRQIVNVALREQARRMQSGLSPRLGEILIEKGVLSPDQVMTVLEFQRKRILVCARCFNQYNTPPNQGPGQAFKCPGCGAVLKARDRPAAINAPAAVDRRTEAQMDTIDDDSVSDAEGAMVGRKVGNCELTRLLGVGGMGEVYKGRHVDLGIPIAVKLLSKSALRNPEGLKRFQREARAAAKLDHPSVVKVYDVGEDGEHHFIEMEFVDGKSLNTLMLKKKRFEPPEACRIVRAALEGLGAAHAAGIVHRDIKPDNILIAKTGEVKLSDFGVARNLDDTMEVTRFGQVVGTPYYMSPEQCDGRAVDARSDLYSLGITLYQVLTGRRPYSGDTPMAIMLHHAKGDYEDPVRFNPAIPRNLVAFMGRLMAVAPVDRYQTAADALEDLDRVEAGQGLSAGGQRRRRFRTEDRHRLVIGGVLLAVALVALGLSVLWAFRPQGPSLTDLLADARRSMEAGRYEEAAAKGAAILLTYPDSADAAALGVEARHRRAHDRGLERMEAGDLEAAIQAFAEAAELKVGEALRVRNGEKLLEARFKKAEAAGDDAAGRLAWDEALAAYEEALTHARSPHAVSRIEDKARASRAGRDRAREEVELFGTLTRDGYYELGQGNLVRAIELLERAAAIRQDAQLRDALREAHYKLHFGEGERLREAGDWVAALEAYEVARPYAPRPEDTAGLDERVADCRGREFQRNMEEARARFRSREWEAARAAAEAGWGYRREGDPQADELARIRFESQRFLDTPRAMAYCPGGSFPLGSADPGDSNPERGAVALEGFYIDRTECTNEAFHAFIEAGGYRDGSLWEPEGWARVGECTTQGGDPGPRFWRRAYPVEGTKKLPVVGISWFEATAFARWSHRRLPSGDEWEVAATWDPRRGARRLFPWGDEFDQVKGVFTTAAASTRDDRADTSALGVQDLGGNVSEWVGGPGLGARRESRGGSYLQGRAEDARPSRRSWVDPFDRDESRGFRTAQ